jgi:DNA-binding NarL/FixJ family response regulator
LVTAVQTVVAGGTFVTPSIREKLRYPQRDGRAATQLSKREREVIKLIALGKSSKEIGRIMDISPRTVDTYRKRLMEKLGLHSLADVVRYAVRAGMVS